MAPAHRALARGGGRLSSLFSRITIPRTVLSLADQALFSGTSFLTTVIVGRTCSPAELGMYALAVSLILFGRGLQEQLISAPYMIRCQRQRPEELPAYSGSNLIHQFLLMLACTGGLIAYGLFRQVWGGPTQLDHILLLLGSLTPFLLTRDYVRHLAFARFRFQSLLILDSAACLLQLSLLGMLVYTDSLHTWTALVAMGIANGLGVLLWFALRSEQVRFERNRMWSDWLDAWSFGRWALASFVVNCAAPLVMPWVMMFAINPAAAGLLAACTSLVGLANTFVLGVSNYLSPKAANAFAVGGLGALNRVLRETALVFGLTIGGLVGVMLLEGDQIAKLVYGPDYAGSGTILFVLSLGVLFNSMSITCGNGLWAVQRPAANFRADVCSLTVAIVVTALCVPLWGVLGAALASALAPAAGTLVRWRSYRRVTRSLMEEAT